MKQITLLFLFVFGAINSYAQDLKITEIMYNPSGADTNWEWVEIYNSSLETVDLSGFVFDDNAASSLNEANILNGTIPSHSSAILFNAKNISEQQFQEVWGNVNIIAVSVWPTLGNSGDGLALWSSFADYEGDNQNRLNAIMQLTYDKVNNGWPDDDGKASIYLKTLASDNTIGGNWALSVVGVDTPLHEAYISEELHGNSGKDVGSPGPLEDTTDDNIKPVISCSDDIITSAGAENCELTLSLELPTATDNSDGPITYASIRNDNFDLEAPFSIGETVITWTAMDASGNVSEPCFQKVTVTDDTAPVITCLETIVKTSLNGNSVLIEISPASAIDLCEGEVLVNGLRSDAEDLDATYPVGETIITWQATDASGNLSECEQTIVVNYVQANANAITSFVIDTQIGETIIDADNKTVTLTMPYISVVTSLAPVIEVSEYAEINPNSEVLQDFTNAVLYTVTAQDGTQQEWTVTVQLEAQTTTLQVTSYTLINAETNEDLFEIEEGMKISINSLPTLHLDIRANTTADVESVYFSLEGVLNTARTESLVPYALFQDYPVGDFKGSDFLVGAYEVTAKPYAGDNLQGEIGTPLTVNFELVDTCQNFEVVFDVITDILTCNSTEGGAVVITNGGVAPISYSWSHDATLIGDTVTGLSVGIYTVTATDATNCSAELTFTFKDPDLPEVSLLSFEALLETDEPIVLVEGQPFGGTYSGVGVTDGEFDPSIGSGVYAITYTYTDPSTECQNEITGELEVLSSNQMSVTSFTLVNADTNEDLFELVDGMQIDINSLSTMHLDIRANTTEVVESVQLTAVEGASRIENVSPYALFGDFPQHNYLGNDFSKGEYIVTAIPYGMDNGKGETGESLTIQFELIDACALFEISVVEVLNPTTCSGTDGFVKIAFEGGVEPINFAWSHSQELVGALASDLLEGSYTVIATDANNCNVALSFELSDPELPMVSLEQFAKVFDDDTAFALTGGLPDGGIYQGEGVNDGIFDPSIGEGTYEIIYSYTDSETGCTNEAIETITVNASEMVLAVESFTLVNAITNEDILDITDGMRININTLETQDLNIRANTSNTVESVRLSLSGEESTLRTENVVPYALYGDFPKNDYFVNQFMAGFYEVSAKPYAKDNLTGESGEVLMISFELYSSDLAAKQTNQMHVYPNPVISQTNIQFENKVSVTTIYLYDVLGRLIQSNASAELSSDGNYVLNLHAIPAGTYYIKAQDEKGRSYQKQIVIQK